MTCFTKYLFAYENAVGAIKSLSGKNILIHSFMGSEFILVLDYKMIQIIEKH